MNKLMAAAIRERKVTIILALMVLVYGYYIYYYLPRQENPDTSSPAVQIITVYPGANAKTVEEQVTKPVEDEVSTLDGIDSLRSFSQDNVSIVVAMLGDNVDYEEQWDRLRIALDNLAPKMPDGVMPFEIDTDMTTSTGMILALSSQEVDAMVLSEVAERYKEEISALEGVKRVEILGVPELSLEVKVNVSALQYYGISMGEVLQIIQAQNVVIPSGSLETDLGKINVQVPKSVSALSDLEQMTVAISPTTGAMVRVVDIATVAMTSDKGDQYFEREGRAAVLVTATFDDNQNVVLIGKDVRALVDQLHAGVPKDVIVDEVLFQPEDVSNAINDFIESLLQGILFVVIVVFVGMGIRSAMIVSVAIPLSLAITMVAMGALKVELHQVSIAALIIALGMLVDNAIVINDAIQVYINAGKSKFESCYLGAKEQAIPVLTSTLTTIVAFLPLMSLPSSAGEFISSMPLIVNIALLASFVVAMLVTPALASIFLKVHQPRVDFVKHINPIYLKLLNGNLKRPVISLLLMVVIVAGAIGLFFTMVDMRLFPFVDKDLVYINISNEISGDIDSTERLMTKAKALLLEEKEIYEATVAVGGGLPRFYMTADLVMPSEANGQILARFDLSKGGRFNTRAELLYYLQNKFDKAFVGGYATVNMLEINMPGATLEARVSGDDNQETVKVAEQIYGYLLDRGETMNVQLRKPQYRYSYDIQVDETKALQLGLTNYDIQSQINLALHGAQASTYIQEGHQYPIVVKGNAEDIEQLMGMAIKSRATGETILLKQIATVDLKRELDVMRRFNRENFVTVLADVRPDFGSGRIQSDLESFIASIDTSNVHISYGGDQETIARYLSGLYVAAAFALAGIFLILMIQFNSILQPLIILATVPLALIGVILALIITGTNFTFTVGLGAASLSGVVVNNAILLVEYINRARAEGASVIEACRDSVTRRMRPILLTTITTVFGLVPLLFADSSFFTPMAIALMGGLLVATFNTLTVIPTLYYVLARFEQPKTLNEGVVN